MKTAISTLDVRRRLGAILNCVSLRHDQFTIQRKGRPLAVLMPVGQVENYEKAAKAGLLKPLKDDSSPSLSDGEAMKVANQAKHESRKK